MGCALVLMGREEGKIAISRVGIVRDKSNLKIGHENYPKTVRFF